MKYINFAPSFILIFDQYFVVSFAIERFNLGIVTIIYNDFLFEFPFNSIIVYKISKLQRVQN